jgi:hypothetical protein
MHNLPSIIKPWNHVQMDASSPVCLELAKQWYDTCTASHDSCLSLDSIFVPTRLIKIEGGDEEWTVRLVNRFDTSTRYAALSHRWKDDVLKSTPENLHSMFHGIPRSLLSKTFHDALLICKSLGIFYLWIDSICIVQHCQNDWEHESIRMADTYQNASLVIAASAATDGILVPRSTRSINSCVFQDVETSVEVFVSPQVHHNEEVLAGRNRQEPLSMRAWTMQERMLARRFLSFTTAEVQWECQSHSVCECSSRDDVSVGRLDRHAYDLKNILGGDDRSVYSWWGFIVRMYSVRKLTVASDKLPAISAVARRFHTRLASQYLAGLWRGNLLNGLIWRQYRDEGPILDRIPSDYRAPSWSWASIDSECFTPILEYREQEMQGTAISTVIDVQCVPATTDQFGQVRCGFVTLRGPLVHCWVSFPSHGILAYRCVNLYDRNNKHLQDGYVFIPDTALRLTTTLNAKGEQQNGAQRTNIDHHELGDNPQQTYNQQPAETGNSLHTVNLAKVWCLWLLEHDVLVLGRNTDSPDKFVRLGIFTKVRGHKRCDRVFENSIVTTVTIV